MFGLSSSETTCVIFGSILLVRALWALPMLSIMVSKLCAFLVFYEWRCKVLPLIVDPRWTGLVGCLIWITIGAGLLPPVWLSIVTVAAFVHVVLSE